MNGTEKRLNCSCEQCALSQFCLARDLLGPEKAHFNSVISSRRLLERGQNLFMVGDRFYALYILHSGSAKSYILSEGGEQQITGFHLPGELIGIDGLDTYTHAYGIEILETSSVCELPMAELDRLIVGSWALRHRFLSLIGRALVDEKQMLLTLGKLRAEQRFARFLLDMSHRYSLLGTSPTEFNLSMPRNDIANYLGLVVETISRIIRRFQDDGIIQVKRRWVRILNLEKLQMFVTQPAAPGTVLATNLEDMSSEVAH